MNCYICQSSTFKIRKGQVRDASELKILVCINCGLVFLSSFEHINPGFYEDSPIVGVEVPSIEFWLKLTDLDDQRRFEMLSSILENKKLLDFGCGAGGFLNKAQTLAAFAAGIESEQKTREYWAHKIKIYSGIDSARQDKIRYNNSFSRNRTPA